MPDASASSLFQKLTAHRISAAIIAPVPRARHLFGGAHLLLGGAGMFEHTRALFEHLNRAGEASPATTLLPIAISGAVALSGVWIAMDHRPWMRFAVVSDVLWLFFGRGGFPSLVLLGICFWILSVPASPGESEVGRV